MSSSHKKTSKPKSLLAITDVVSNQYSCLEVFMQFIFPFCLPNTLSEFLGRYRNDNISFTQYSRLKYRSEKAGLKIHIFEKVDVKIWSRCYFRFKTISLNWWCGNYITEPFMTRVLLIPTRVISLRYLTYKTRLTAESTQISWEGFVYLSSLTQVRNEKQCYNLYL